MIVPRSLKTKRNTIFFQDRPNFFYLKKIICDPFIFVNNRFSKILSIYSYKEGFMSQSWAKMSNFITLSLRLSGIEFSLV